LYDSNLPESEINKAVLSKKKDFPDGIPECGTDALRFTLLSYMMQSSINLDVKRVIGYRTFCNKIWNVSRFAIIMNFPKDFVPEKDGVASCKLGLFDKWILTCLNNAVTQVRQNFDDFKFGEMVSRQHEFWLYELADVYIESIKPVL
jgi:valyl-tRNA synthetase